MVKKMSLMGVAGKIMIVLLVSLAVTEGVSLRLAPAFRLAGDYRGLVIAAVVMASVGFAFNLIAAFSMLSAHRKGRLATSGLYALFLNPMYAFQLLLTVPGLLLLLNSWLALLAVVPAFLAFKVFAKEEETYLEGKFGALYLEYRNKVLFKFL
jgi:protein-S-isoprenylcysteine O-methyltransferase Ste14